MTTLSLRARVLLGKRLVAVLATTNEDGTPHLSAMWYALDSDHITMNTKAGRVKERNMRRNPHVSVCVVDKDSVYCYVAISGRVEIIDDLARGQEDIYRLALRYDGAESAAQQMAQRFSKEHRVTMRLSLKDAKIAEYFSS